MSTILAVPPPAPGPSFRADGGQPQAGAVRSPPPQRAETARAPQPVESAGQGREIRLSDRDGRPVGPPPAFRVTLLQVLREAAMEPARATTPADGFAGPATEPEPALFDRKV